MNQFDVEKRWAKSFTVLVPTFWRLAKLSPLLPFHDGHKVLCLDICIGNIIRLYRSNILPRNKGWTAKIRTSHQFNFPAKLLQLMIHYFVKLWLLWSKKGHLLFRPEFELLNNLVFWSHFWPKVTIEIVNNKARHNLIDAKWRWRCDRLDGAGSFREPLRQTKVMQIRQRETQIHQWETTHKICFLAAQLKTEF